jgi:hypothetical protein
MRKLIGLCFLTATLLASSANAQSMFIDKGDPSTMGFSLGGHLGGGGNLGGVYTGSLNFAFSYRGVVDIGLDASGSVFSTRESQKTEFRNLALDLMPFMAWHVVRSDADEFPISIALLVGVEKVLYFSNAPYTSPSGWGVLAGGSIYRSFELGTSILLIPELLAAYEFTSTQTYHSLNAGKPNGYSSDPRHNARAILRINLGLKSGGHVITVSPYGGHAGYALGRVVGLTVGFVL